MSYFTCNSDYAFGLDLSSYNVSRDLQHWPDFTQIQAHSPQVAFIGLRAGVSWGFQDPAFKQLAAKASGAGLCLLPYHVIFPSQPAQRQMDNFMRALKGLNLDRVRLVLDLELDESLSRAEITKVLLTCLQVLHQQTGRWPVIYSRALWVNEHLRVSDLPHLDWWLAHYAARQPAPAYTPEQPCPPWLPAGVDHWLIHQTGDRCPAVGGFGRYMDYDRWNGSHRDVWSYFGREAGTPNQSSIPLEPGGTAGNTPGQDCPQTDKICIEEVSHA